MCNGDQARRPRDMTNLLATPPLPTHKLSKIMCLSWLAAPARSALKFHQGALLVNAAEDDSVFVWPTPVRSRLALAVQLAACSGSCLDENPVNFRCLFRVKRNTHFVEPAFDHWLFAPAPQKIS